MEKKMHMESKLSPGHGKLSRREATRADEQVQSLRTRLLQHPQENKAEMQTPEEFARR